MSKSATNPANLRFGCVAVGDCFSVTEISDLPPAMRARRYLDLADDARRGAVACKGELRAHFLYLAMQWEKLAADWSDYLEKRPDAK